MFVPSRSLLQPITSVTEAVVVVAVVVDDDVVVIVVAIIVVVELNKLIN